MKALYAVVPVSVAVPGLPGRYFEATQGLKQGCPLSPTLFDLYITDFETRLLQAAAARDELGLPTLVPHQAA